LNNAIERAHGHQPVTNVTDKAPAFRRVICKINRRYDGHFNSIRPIDWKCRNNLIETDHAALKWRIGYREIFRSLRSAKATLNGMETVWTAKRGQIHQEQSGVLDKSQFIAHLF